MSKNDWYRKKTWTEKDQEELFARLERSRTTYNKAQYLRIQAYYLQEEMFPPNYQSALQLLDQLIMQYPEPSELGMAYLQRAKCLEALGKGNEALESLGIAVKKDVNPSGVHTTDAAFYFAIYVAQNRLKDYFDAVLDSFKGAEIVSLLPVNQYMMCAAMSLIAHHTDKKRDAHEYAMKAGNILKSSPSLETSIDPELQKQISALAEPTPSKWWRLWQ